jgi:hypothetical protein
MDLNGRMKLESEKICFTICTLLPNIIRVTNSRRMRRAGHVARMKRIRNLYRF